MSQIISKSWSSVLVLALLAASTVQAQPIRQNAEEATTIEARSPRLIPDTENYVHEIFQGLGLAEPSSTKTQTQTQTKTPTATVKAEQGQTENKLATPTTHIIYESSISYTPTYGSDGAGFTHTVKHQASINKPIENIQIGHDWEKGGKFEAKDLPLLFDALTRELEHRVGNMIDSSDEVGLDEFTDGL